MKKILIIGLMLVLCFSCVTVSAEGNNAHCSLATSAKVVTVGDSFNVVLWLDTNFETTGFTLRQMIWDSNLAEMTYRNFSEQWYDPGWNDIGTLQPGNLTYAMANNFAGIEGSYAVMEFTFKTLNPGALHITIPDAITFGLGQPGLEIAFADTLTWDNLDITIKSQSSPPPPPQPPGPPPPPPPDNKKPVAV
ncbi:unnamed protein product, partial [marine sediment metagenome]